MKLVSIQLIQKPQAGLPGRTVHDNPKGVNMLTVYSAYMRGILNRIREESGQGLAEYALILALVAVVVVAALIFLQGGISGLLSNVGSKL